VTSLPRVGVFGGSFDPVHFGHLIMAGEAADRLRLDHVVFVPANRPAHKRSRSLAGVRDRLAMLRLATRGNPRFRVSAIEAERGGISFTADTLEAMARRDEGSLYFILGEDSLAEFHTWREPARIAGLAKLVVVPRGDLPKGATARRSSPALPRAWRRRVITLDPPRIGISSTEIRRRVRGGKSVRYWVPDPVLSYMARHALYGSGRP
jgi:nicotinate-nucleotide adenylyltransferase